MRGITLGSNNNFMRPIEGSLFSPFEKKISKPSFSRGFRFSFKTETIWEKLDATVNKVRASKGFPVKTFRQLVDEVANVTLSNKSYEMYYRGQTKDYKNNQAKFYKDRTPKTTILPTICRPERKEGGGIKYSIRKKTVQERYRDLAKMIELMEGNSGYMNEHYYSLFQHYDILPTPFIDITQSLRVAASFALQKSHTGYVYVFGLPYPNQSISYYTDLGIILIKLQNVVDVSAKRPRYQEGYLVGKFPIKPTKTNGDDLANRMVAKFLVDNSNGKFWDKYFQPMPEEVLYPEQDETKKELLKVKGTFQSLYGPR
jgi:hypothetical protein